MFKQPRKFFLVLALCIALAAGASFFFFQSPETTKWNLVTYHVTKWGDTSIFSRAVHIVVKRIPDFMHDFNIYIFLAFLLLLCAVRDERIKVKIKPHLRNNAPMVVTGIGLTLFSASHLGTGGWHREYFVPAAMSLAPIFAIMFGKVYSLQKDSLLKSALQGILIVGLLLNPLRYNVQHIDISGQSMPVEEIRDVAAYISGLSSSSDKILVLEALLTAIDSNRSVLPGLTMAQFSYQNINRKEAEKLNLANGEIVLAYINDCTAKIVILTDSDWELFRLTRYDELIRQALSSRYDLVLTKEAFGQGANTKSN
jgi:hypothetical protein